MTAYSAGYRSVRGLRITHQRATLRADETILLRRLAPILSGEERSPGVQFLPFDVPSARFDSADDEAIFLDAKRKLVGFIADIIPAKSKDRRAPLLLAGKTIRRGDKR